MLHHLSFSVADLERSGAFYDVVLLQLGYFRVCESRDFVGYGTEVNKDRFSLKRRVSVVAVPSAGFHLAFAASSREAVDDFHTAAISAGGIDNGAPGLRPQYGESYYAAFVRDPDGYDIEAVINR